MTTEIKQSVSISQYWFVAILAISATPIVQAMLTTTFDGEISYIQLVIRILSIITVLTDIFIINLAIKAGLFNSTKIERICKNKYLIICILAIVLMSIAHQSDSVYFSIFITLRYICQILTIFALTFIISSSPNFNDRRYIAIIAILGILYVAYIAVVALMVPHPSNFPWVGGLPSATNIRHIGNYVALFSIASMASFLLTNDRSRWSSLATLFVMTVFLAWTGSRAPFVGLAIALLAAVLVLRRHIPATRVGILATTMTAAVLLSISLPTPDPQFGVIRMITATDSRQSNDISSARFELWKNTVHEIAEAPMFGHGSGRFISNMSQKYGYDLDNPHNFVLQFAYDWGLLGLMFALFFIVRIGFNLITMPATSPILTFCAVSGFTLMISLGMLEGMFYHPLKMLLASALVAPAFALANRECDHDCTMNMRKKLVAT